MLAFFSKVHWQRRLGGALFGSGLLSLMLTPWTLPFLLQARSGISSVVWLACGFVGCWVVSNRFLGSCARWPAEPHGPHRRDRHGRGRRVVAQAMHWWC